MMKQITFFSLLASLCFLIACGGSKSAVDESAVSFGDAQLQAQMEELKDKIDDEPNSMLYRRQLAELYYQNGEGLEALRVLERAIVINPADGETKYMYAETAEVLGDHAKAFQAYKEVLQSVDGEQYLDRIAPKFADAFFVEKLFGDSSDQAFGNFSADGAKVVYQSNQNGNWDIFEYDLNTQAVKQLTFSEAHEENPDYSPDGKTLVYSSTLEDRREVDYDQKLRDIYVLEFANNKNWNLTTNGSNDWRPRFSSDGKYITFVSERNDLREVPFYQLHSNVFFMEKDGRFQMLLTKEEDNNNGSPVMTPGTTEYSGDVFFDSNRNGSYSIYKIDIRGEEARQITFDPVFNDVSPDISANGDKIVFFSDRDGNYELYLMNTDGSAQQRLTSNPADDVNPVFSPDGTKILFHANRRGNYDLYLLDLQRESGVLKLYEVVAKIDEAIQGLQ